jgi:basic amino acid/polyamine antiporter, APA family
VSERGERRRAIRGRLPTRDLTRRALGVPWLFAVSYSAIGFSIYFSIGLVADRGLALTPLIFLGVGVIFMLNAMTYIEGASMFRERGGSSTLARHAFNELVAFIAGWAILIDYLIVIALAAISVPHYLTPISASFAGGSAELVTAGVVIAAVAAINIVGFSGSGRQFLLTAVAIGGVLLLAAVVVVGALTSFDAGALTAQLDLFASPTLEDVVYAGVIATVAYAGIEAASDLAPDLEFQAIDLKRLVAAGIAVVPVLYTGVAAIAVMAVPVVDTPAGPETALATTFLEEPLLGVVTSYDPAWVADGMRVAMVIVAPLVLAWAASTSMLGLSRHVYTLATHRQIPSWLGKLGRTGRTPYVAILIAAVIAFGLVIPGDVLFLAGLYAFGATIAFTIAHASLIRLRMTQPDARRPFRVPLAVRMGGAEVPLPALVAGVLTAGAWVSVLLFHEEARYIGSAWMLFGLVAYAIYRVGVEKTSLTRKVSVPAEALVKDVREAEYGGILVPVFGTPLDDDIVSTAGRLAAADDSPDGSPPHLEVIYVLDVPLKIPLDARPRPERMEVANAALQRAQEVGEEYDTVEVATSVVRAREVGPGIVQAARERDVELIVMGAEPPTRIRGGAVLGGVGGSRPDEVGPVTAYVLRKAPCRVLLTAPALAPGEKPAFDPRKRPAVDQTSRPGGSGATAGRD